MVSSLAGIGGGSLSVPFLNRHGVEMRKAVGSSSVCGCFIAMAGMIGFILHGYQAQSLPMYSLGYVYLPALLAIASASMLTTRIGAKMATSLPTHALKKSLRCFCSLSRELCCGNELSFNYLNTKRVVVLCLKDSLNSPISIPF